ncbi:MAG: DUF2125 domain-containing protein, partial [Pseudomonadota bacterium]
DSQFTHGRSAIMSYSNPKPSMTYAGRIKWLAFAIGLVIAVYTGGWFYAARHVSALASVQIADLEATGISIDCPDRLVRGYPFRIGVFCSDFSVDAPREGLLIDGGALRSAAQVYDPRRAVIEIDAPLTVQVGEDELVLDYAVGQAVVEARAAGLRSLAAEFTNGSGRSGDLSARWARMTFFSRTVDDDLEVALQTVDLVPNDLRLPPLSADADLLIEDASYEMSSLRGKNGEVRRLTLGLSDDRGVLVQGPFSVSVDGLLDADLDVRVVDVPGLIADLQASAPRIAAAIDGILQLSTPTGDNGDEAALTVTIREGRARLGIVPLGTIPPL